MAQLLKGAPAAAALTEELAKRCGALKEKNIRPTLALLRVGENESDLAYERGILKRCDAVGIEVRKILLPADTGQESVLAEIKKILFRSI